MTGSHQNATGQSGFTLIELLAVLLIAAFTAALVLPRTTGWQSRTQFKAATAGLVAALKATRSAAMQSSSAQTLTVEPATRTYHGDAQPAPRRLPPHIAMSRSAQQGEAESLDALAFAFKPDGSATPGTITLSSGREQALITVDWLTGRVSVHFVR